MKVNSESKFQPCLPSICCKGLRVGASFAAVFFVLINATPLFLQYSLPEGLTSATALLLQYLIQKTALIATGRLASMLDSTREPEEAKEQKLNSTIIFNSDTSLLHKVSILI